MSCARNWRRDARGRRDSVKRAREVQSGATRAAVLGVSDGLVTNVSLILGVGVGATLGYLSGRSLARSAARQLLVLVLAAGATWAAGRLFNVAVS